MRNTAGASIAPCAGRRSRVRWPPTQEATMSFRFTGDEVKKLSDAQKDTIIDVVVAGVLSDGKVAAEEEQKLDSEFRKVDWGRSEGEMLEKIQASVQKVSNTTDPLSFIKNAAATLTDQGVREKTFAMLARLVLSDKQLDGNEGVVMTAFM